MKYFITKDFVYGLTIGVLVLVAFGFRAAVEGAAGEKWEYLVVRETTTKWDIPTFYMFQGSGESVTQEIPAKSDEAALGKLEFLLGVQGWELVVVEAPFNQAGGSQSSANLSSRILHFKRAL